MFREEKVAVFFEMTIIFRLREEYKFYQEMQTLHWKTRLVPFLIMMISAGISGLLPIHSSQDPSHKYITVVFFFWFLLQLH